MAVERVDYYSDEEYEQALYMEAAQEAEAQAAWEYEQYLIQQALAEKG